MAIVQASRKKIGELSSWRQPASINAKTIKSAQKRNIEKQIQQSLKSKNEIKHEKPIENTIALREPHKQFEEVNASNIENYEPKVKDLVDKYQPLDAFINKTKDRMVLTMRGDKTKEHFFTESIRNKMTGWFGGVPSDLGLQHYREMYSTSNEHVWYIGEDEQTLNSNFQNNENNNGGNYYSTVSFKIKDGKFYPDTIIITDSAEYAAEKIAREEGFQKELEKEVNLETQKNKETLTDEQIASRVENKKQEFIKSYVGKFLIKYAIFIDADFKTDKITDKKAEIIDVLQTHKSDTYKSFFEVGSPNDQSLKKDHSFISMPWIHAVQDRQSKWTSIEGHLEVIQPRSNPIDFDKMKHFSKLIAEMQASHGSKNNRHADDAFVKDLAERNKAQLN